MLAAMTRVLLTELDTAGHAERQAMVLPRLHVEEQARYHGFAAEARRHAWLAGRALLLAALEQATGDIDAGALRTAASGGVVYAAAPLYLNLSHSGTLLAAAVSSRPVGVDIERVRPRNVVTQADRVFCAGEARALDALQDAARLERFFQLWTLKEAACKAAELSIWDGLSNACFDLDAGTCRFAPPFPTGPWRLMQGGFDTDWRLAVAVRSESLDLSCRRVNAGVWHDQTLDPVRMLQGE